ncbi:MAG: PD40 domain-containing protein [Planctomycetes bacterium]|nr:PD40 domain-containing protein [Planctomycetota bacterium]
MRILPNTGKNLVIVLALLAAGFLVAYLRFRPYLGREATYTDGASNYSVASGERLRYAIWDKPEALGKDVNTATDESRPALSRDDRFLVFAVGKAGLNADLWIAEMVGGQPVDAHPLGALNTDFDECSPAFTSDGRALLFASNRPGGAGGLDLWRAPYADGAFGAAESLGAGVNTAADECDPASVPGSDAIVFASNRPRGARRDFDLWIAPLGPSRPISLDAVDSPFDEREPAFASDGRALLFASNRAGGTGGFDLYRSVLGETGWMAPEALRGINTEASERGPAPTADGFSMLFAVERPGGSSDLFRARSLELLRVPGRPIGWQDLTLLALLLLVALFAMLAKRWKKLDVIYKCLLISLFLHLLLLWLFQKLLVSGGGPGAIPKRGDGMFKVRSIDAPGGDAQTRARERAGQLEVTRRSDADGADPIAEGPSRAEPAATPSDEPAASPAEVARADAPAESAPNRAAEAPAQAEPAGRTTVALDDAERSLARLDGVAAAVDVRAAARSASRSENGTEEAGRAHLVVATPRASGPSRAALSKSSTPADAAPARGRSAVRPADELSALEMGVDVQTPDEQVTKSDSAAPEMSIAPGASAAPANRTAQRPERGASPSATESLASSPAAPKARPLAPTRSTDPTDAENAAASSRGRIVASKLPARSVPGVAVQDRETVLRIGSDADVGANRVADPAPLATSAKPPSTGASQGAPLRQSVADASTAMPASPQPNRGGERAARRDDAAGSESLPISRGALRAAPSGASDVPAVGIRAPSEPVQARLGDAAGGEPAAVAVAPRSLGTRAVSTSDSHTPPERLSSEATSASVSPNATRGTDRPVARTDDATSATAAPRSDLGSSPVVGRSLPAITVQSPAESRPTPREDSGKALAPELAVGPRALASRTTTAAGIGEPEPRRFASDVALADARPNQRPMDVAANAEVVPAPTAPDRGRFDATPYRNRFGEEKAIALRDHGGNEETENAVGAGLRYLARIQKPEGYWGDPDHIDEKYGAVMIGKSALSLLAFLGAGHTPGSNATHARVAERAVNFLLSAQDEQTGHFGESEAYSNGIATYALAECYALTKDAKLRAPLERAIRHIVDNQNRGRDARRFGGWSYYYPDGHVFDEWPRVSITAWQVMALESARLGGIDVPDRVFDDAKTFLLGSYDKRHGYFRYSQDPERLNSGYRTLPGSTPAALFALSLLGEDPKSSRFEKARGFVLDRAPDGYRYTSDADFVERGMGNLYFWYYGTLALFRCEGDEWDLWNAKMKRTLLPSQEKDGSWRPIDIYSRYAGDDRNDRTYTTAMCVLALEVYYRYFTPLLKVR